MTAQRTGKNLLGLGLYTPSEAALYARVHPSTMGRWIHGNQMGKAVINPQLVNDPDRTVTFLDFVQALAIRAIRREHKVPLPKIRNAVELVRSTYNIDYPFAMKHKTFLLGNEILIEIPAFGRDLIQVSGKHKKQGVMRKVAELYMKDLSFTSDGDLASAYQAFKHAGQKIIMDPSRQFGQPLVERCGYPALVLVEAYRSEGSISGAAKAYGLRKTDIELALRYDDYIRGPMAA